MFSKRTSARLGLGVTVAVFVSMTWLVFAGAKDLPAAKPAAGHLAPNFSLSDTEGNTVTLSSFRGHPVVLFFSSVRCPTSAQYADRIADFTQGLIERHQANVLAIDSNLIDPEAASLDEVRVNAKLTGREYPTLIDRTGQVARQYSIVTTPTVLLIDSAGVARYAGPFDDNCDASLVKDHYCQQAMTAMLAGNSERVILTQALGAPTGEPR